MRIPFTVIIPARYQSTRFPGKPLCMIAGKTMLSHVIDRCQASHASRIIVSTDDVRIADQAGKHDVQVSISPAECRSGSERIAYTLAQIDHKPDDIIVNVQGDEPLISAQNINQLAEILSNTDSAIASLYQPIKSVTDLSNPNVVKVVTDNQNKAQYFSRAAIPFAQNADAILTYLEKGYYRKHIGMYAYRAVFLSQCQSKLQHAYETMESLEQLSWLAAGHAIQMAEAVAHVAMDVNTEDDLEKICQIWDEMAVV